MKRIMFLHLFLLLLMFSKRLNAQTDYFYYYQGQKQYFELDTKHVFISVANKNAVNVFAPNTIQKSLREDMQGEKQNSKHKRFWTELTLESNLSEKQYWDKISEIRNSIEGIIVSPYLTNQFQEKIGLSRFFYVKLKSLKDTVVLKQEAEKENAIVVMQNQFMPLWFVVSITEISKHNAMEISNRFYESGLFECAEPDLMVDDKIHCTYDTYFPQQWGLKNTGQNGGISGVDIKTCDAWSISTGDNIIVAVLDQGIDSTHPDLIDNLYPLSYYCEFGESPQQLKGEHGTPCAGIIGAVKNNNKGIAGVAPNCKLMAISNSMEGIPLSRLTRANGINWAWENGADVISNSWGSSVQYQVIDDAINNAVTQGRNGLGCVVVFASGNDASATVNYPANLPNVITVGAIDRCGIRSGRKDIVPTSCDPWPPGSHPGSNYGSALDVVAPGTNIYTTDNRGHYGYNIGDYVPNVNGTSAACPHVAGVAALILSVEPNLTQLQVRNIIASTAQKVGGYAYRTKAGYPNGTWHEEVGYGLVNAHAAVRAARCVIPVNFINQIVTTNKTVTGCHINVQNVTVQSGKKLTLDAEETTTINGNFEVPLGAELEIK